MRFSKDGHRYSIELIEHDHYKVDITAESGSQTLYCTREELLNLPFVIDHICPGCGRIYNDVEYVVGQCNMCDPFDDEMDEGEMI